MPAASETGHEREFAALLAHAPQVRHAEVSRAQQAAVARAVGKHVASGNACLSRVGAEVGRPLRLIDLHWVMDDIADKQRLLALALGLEENMAGCVPRRRLDQQAVAELMRQVDLPRLTGIHTRPDAVA